MTYLSEEVKQLLTTPKKIIVTMHRDPDADAIGSSLGWAHFLKKIGHTVTVISPTEIASNLHWFEGADEILNFEDREKGYPIARPAIYDADLICCLDFSGISRLKDMSPIIQRAGKPILVIDHHLHPEPFYTHLISDTTAAATAQIIYYLIQEINPELLDATIAECLYAGIMTDTGSFRHSNTTREVHLVVAELMKFDFNANRVHRQIFDNSPLSRLHMLGQVLTSIHVLPEFRTSYMIINLDDLAKYNSGVGDTDGIVNYGLQIEGIVMTALFIQRNREVKISFRSVEDFSVRDLASEHFSGGGHKNASGGRSNLSLSETIEKFLGILPQYQEELLRVTK